MHSLVKSTFALLMLVSCTHIHAQDFTLKKEVINFNYSDTLLTEKSKNETIEQVKFYLKNLSDFSKKKRDYTQSEAGDIWEVKCSFKVSKLGLIGKQVNGAIHYKLHIRIEENKVNYRFSQVKFQPYYRNRYGRFVAKNNVYYPLETRWEKESAYTWEQHQLVTQEKIEKNIATLKYLLQEESIAAEK